MSRRAAPLSADDREIAFLTATSALPKWYSDQLDKGMSDTELALALTHVLGIFGGCCGPGQLCIAFQGAGLKIWAGWHIVNHVTETPIFEGKQTILMARDMYRIADPDEKQLSLF